MPSVLSQLARCAVAAANPTGRKTEPPDYCRKQVCSAATRIRNAISESGSGHSRSAPHVRYQGTADIRISPLDAKCHERTLPSACFRREIARTC